MYHYVREFDDKLPGLRFLHLDSFRRQLDHLEEAYGFVSKADWEAFTRSGRASALQGKVVLTFDDGLACHYRYVFPELVRRGLWGFFFVSSGPYQLGQMLDVHKIHVLCARHGPAELDAARRSLVPQEVIPFQEREAFRRETYAMQSESEQILMFKRTLNYYVQEERRSEIIEAIGTVLGESFSASGYYVSLEQLREMSRAGMVVGAHSVNHRVMSKLSAQEQRRELEVSLGFLREVNGQAPLTYCHPYGGFHTFNEDTLTILASLGVQLAFNVEPRELSEQDWSSQRMALPRFDCNRFPHGQVYPLAS